MTNDGRDDDDDAKHAKNESGRRTSDDTTHFSPKRAHRRERERERELLDVSLCLVRDSK